MTGRASNDAAGNRQILRDEAGRYLRLARVAVFDFSNTVKNLT
jgi:hypothetical protein